MINTTKQDNGYYFSGGLAEIVSQPSVLTYSYLRRWFTGQECLGKAMDLLRLPNEKIDLPILEMKNGELLVNLSNEEQTLYRKTIFVYKSQIKTHTIPQLSISAKKICSPTCLYKTGQMLLVQSLWIANPGKQLRFAKDLLAMMPTTPRPHMNPEGVLINELLPNLISIGILTEFFQQFLYKEHPKQIGELQDAIAKKISSKDWFFKSLSDQAKVKSNTMSFGEYMALYGIRSDKDYELTCPRWSEIPEVIQARIENSHFDIRVQNANESPLLPALADTVAQFQIIRSEAKRKTLFFIDLLRKTLSMNDFASEIENHSTETSEIDAQNLSEGDIHTGMPVSRGLVNGRTLSVKNNQTSIPDGTIGIFPNASPEFAMQYPKCKGMIFLRGGQTSHGAIVAREFGIPALIDENASALSDGQEIELDGGKGEWKICIRSSIFPVEK